jgi:hypothetical protein
MSTAELNRSEIEAAVGELAGELVRRFASGYRQIGMDLVAEGTDVVMAKLESYPIDPSKRVKGLVRRILHNEGVDRIRAERSRRRVEKEAGERHPPIPPRRLGQPRPWQELPADDVRLILEWPNAKQTLVACAITGFYLWLPKAAWDTVLARAGVANPFPPEDTFADWGVVRQDALLTKELHALPNTISKWKERGVKSLRDLPFISRLREEKHP